MSNLFFLLLFSFNQSVPPVAGLSLFPKRALKPTLKLAKEKNLLIVTEFWTFDTEPSRSYYKKTLSKPPILKWLGKYALGARINFDFNRGLRTRFHVKDLPTVLLLDNKLRMWSRITAPQSPEKIVEELEKGRVEREKFLAAQAAIKENPRNAALLLDLLKGYIRQENTKEAEKLLVEFHRADLLHKIGCHEKLAFEIAYIHDLRHENPAAERLYKVAASWALTGKKEFRAGILYNLADLQLRTHKPDKAIKVLELLLSEFETLPKPTKEIFVPHRSEVMYLLGYLYLKDVKNSTKGLELLRKVKNNYSDRFSLAAENLLKILGSDSKDDSK